MSLPEKRLETPHGSLPLPAFLPDATLGVVRSVDSADLERVGVRAVVMNVFHLMQKPGSSTVHALGGLHRMAGWPFPIVTDSGGFQAYSLIRQNPKQGSLSDAGIRFRPEGAGREFLLTPEKSVQLQLAYGADVVICLDDCTHADAPAADQETSVQRTVAWAGRCKAEFELQMQQRRARKDGPMSPRLFAVVQGGSSAPLRTRCAETLLDIGFDGYGFGGWPFDGEGRLLSEMLEVVRAAIPQEFPLHALGVGQPEHVVTCTRMGYDLFDCALPTRDARTGRLYVWASPPEPEICSFSGTWRRTVYIDDDKHRKADTPISPGCDCPTCALYSLGYLRHLRKCGDTLYFRLATLHNLRFMSRLIELLSASVPPWTESDLRSPTSRLQAG